MSDRTKRNEPTTVLVDAIVKGIFEKKGKEVIALDLQKIHSAVCDYFIVCHGTSRTHALAVAESVEEEVKKLTGMNPARREGFANGEWILIDYLDVVVHVFQEPVRRHFQIEELWADLPLKRFSET